MTIRRKHRFHAKADDAGGGGSPEDAQQGEIIEETQEREVKPNWPDNWRELYAGDDEKKLSRLSRYTSPSAALDAMIAAQNRISSGELRSTEPFPAEGSDEDKANWRKEHGIPEGPDKYDLSFDDGLTIGEDDKPIIEDFLAAAHQGNMAPEHVKQSVRWYYDLKEKQEEQRAEKDNEVSQATEDALRAEWGSDYRPTLNRIHGLLDTAPEGVKDLFLDARLGDGTPLGSHEGVLKFLADLATQINPVTTVVPGAGTDLAGTIDDEIARYESMMSDKNSEYWKGPKADKNQARLRDLYSARERMSRKAS